MVGGGGDTDVGGNPANVNIPHLLCLQRFIQRRLAELGVVEKGRVRIYIWIATLVDNAGLGMNLG